LNKKLFERVFNIPINIDDFEIDIEETNKTQSGKNSLIHLRQNNSIIEDGTKVYLNKRTKNDIILEDLFVTVDNLI
jgi:hypothetical protein